MNFDFDKSLQILERTPLVLETLLKGLSDEWIYVNEGENTWSAFDVIGHLIHGEKTDWIARVNIILGDNSDKHFKPFDRFAQFEESKGKTINHLLDEFKSIRANNLTTLKKFVFTPDLLNKKGIHPHFGEVTLHNLLSTWVTHDLEHIGQIVRVMAKHYKEDVGPWVEYMRILT
jgi:hypothetical protein